MEIDLAECIARAKKDVRIITIGGVSGTGKGTSGPQIAKALAFNYYATGEAYRERATELKMTLPQFAEYAAQHPDEDRMLDAAVYKKSLEGSWVFDGRLPALIIPDAPDVCRVLFTCPDDVRFKRIAKRSNVGIREAARLTRQREAAYARQYKEIYGLDDVTDPRHFDFEVATESRTPEEVTHYTIWRIAQHVEGVPSHRTCSTTIWEQITDAAIAKS